ncbi:NDR1/HIN1-like protein 12 [Nymphaea colorata]|uniref:Late embryogenesis abundant protein LEA-2 subgroup domain-containing protein n=1 Tax=Nymphaea colorata TaxID=210225 RepID=A0A5K0WX48_9MAGN|nr:NDR1/HIN1-like protein 12 [Nymphaea colorata]
MAGEGEGPRENLTGQDQNDGDTKKNKGVETESPIRDHRHHQRGQPPRRRSRPPPQALRCSLCLFLVALLLLMGITTLIVWLVYRPHRPRFNVQAAAVYELNATALTTITASMQFTVAARNPNKRSSAEFRNIYAFVSFRDQAITANTPLPDLNLAAKSTVVISPILGGGFVPISPEVSSGLAMAEAYGLVPMRWILQGRLRWRSGVFKSGFYGIYVKCDVMVGLKPGLAGQVPLLGAPDCAVDL